MIEDTELLRRYARERDEDAFRELVRRHVDFVFGAAARRMGGDAHAASDVTQQVFTALARKAERLAHGVVLTAWLYTITRNVAADFVRAEQRRRTREQEAHTMQEPNLNDGDASQWERLRPLLDAALDALPRRDRDAVLLRFFAQRPFAEIGATLRISEDAARMRVDRALEKLQAMLARRGITSTNAALGVALAHQAAIGAPAGLANTVVAGALSHAAAVSVAGAWAVLLHLMNSTKFTAGAVTICVLLAAGTAGHHLREEREAAAALAAVEGQHQARLARLHALNRRTQALEAEKTQIEARLAEADTAARAKDAAAKAVARDLLADGKAFLERHPELARIMDEERNARVNTHFVALYARLGLTPEQISQFQRLVRRAWDPAASTTIRVEGKPLRLGYETEPLPPGGLRDGLRALLGDEGVAEYFRTYTWEHREAQRATLRVANDLCFTPEPLTPAQAQQLLDILHAGFAGKRGALADIDWDTIDAATRRLLSAEQRIAWETALTRTRYQISPAWGSSAVPAQSSKDAK